MAAACIGEFIGLAQRDLANLDAGEITDQDIADIMTAAVRLYAARAEAREKFPPPLVGERVTATEVAIIVSEMVRVADLNMFDLSMWHGRTRGRE